MINVAQCWPEGHYAVHDCRGCKGPGRSFLNVFSQYIFLAKYLLSYSRAKIPGVWLLERRQKRNTYVAHPHLQSHSCSTAIWNSSRLWGLLFPGTQSQQSWSSHASGLTPVCRAGFSFSFSWFSSKCLLVLSSKWGPWGKTRPHF